MVEHKLSSEPEAYANWTGQALGDLKQGVQVEICRNIPLRQRLLLNDAIGRETVQDERGRRRGVAVL